jgi:two-component system cell cycle sensor histidine kinase/response regulator CckA
VDDDRMQVAILTALLKQAGFRVLAAPSGVAALAALDHAGNAVDAISLLVTDLDMPGMDGREFARHVKTQNPAIKVLFVTANPDGLFKAGRPLGDGEAFLEKPVTQPLLREAVNMLLHGGMR